MQIGSGKKERRTKRGKEEKSRGEEKKWDDR